MKNCERKRAHKQSNHRHRASNSKPSYKLTLRHLKVGRPGGKENLRESTHAHKWKPRAPVGWPLCRAASKQEAREGE